MATTTLAYRVVTMESRAPRVGHKKSRKGCAQCKRRHVKCNEEAPCSNCTRHNVKCSLAGGPIVERTDARRRRSPVASAPSLSRTTSRASEGSTRATASASTSFSETTSRRSSQPRSPFSVLSGLFDRNHEDTDRDWMLNLQLMHHYMTNTQLIMTEHYDLDKIWHIEMPKIAFTSDYVMHALLGFTALHKAHLEPEQAGALRASAVVHLDQALVSYRQDTGPATAENSDARFAFTWLVALFAYAIPPSVPPIDAMAELFLLVKGIDAILAETWGWVSQGPFSPMLTRSLQEAFTVPAEGSVNLARLGLAPSPTFSPSFLTEFDDYTVPEGLEFGPSHLDFMLGIDAMLPEDRRVCALILAELKQMYGNLHGKVHCDVATVLRFPKQDAAPFSELLKRRVPQSLIILAYYTVLLDVLNSRWWINGWASRVLRDIVSTLDDRWKAWIQWPIQSVLMKVDVPVLAGEDLVV